MTQQILHLLSDYIFIANIILASIVLFFERKRPVNTLFWIVILLLTSYVGFIAYLFFGLQFYKKRNTQKFYSRNFLRQVYKKNHYKVHLVEKRARLTRYISSTTGNRVTYLNNTYFYKEGRPFFRKLIEDLRRAKESIHMEYYIFNDDSFGGQIYDLLIQKAEEGVKIRIIVDGIGTKNLSRKRKKQLKKAGIELGVFFPSYFPFFKFFNLRANYRDHRKLCIIDGLILFTGGFNIGKEYIGEGKFGHWRDTGARIHGEVAIDANREFMISWGFIQKQYRIKNGNELLKKKVDEIARDKERYHVNAMQVVSSGPNYQTRTIRDIFLSMIANAKRSIYIETPYLVPDDLLLESLKIALIAGIEVKIIVPNVGDHPFIYWANQGFIVELLEAGAEIYRYQDGFFHSKFIVVDNEIASFGSANFDYRSHYQNFEINFNVYDLELVGYLKQIFFKDIAKSKSLSYEEMKKRKVSEKIRESISRLLSPIM